MEKNKPEEIDDDSGNIDRARKILGDPFDKKSQIEEIEFTDDSGAPKELSDPGSFDELDRKLAAHPLHDLGNSERLRARYKDDIKFVIDAGWCGWVDTHWSFKDGEHIVMDRAQKTARAFRKEALYIEAAGCWPNEDPEEFQKRCRAYRHWATQSGMNARIKGMINQVQPHVKANSGDFDSGLYLFNVENGTLNLDSPEVNEENPAEFPRVVLEHHAREHLITKMAGVKYDSNATCDTFIKFIHEIQPDAEIREFLQRWFGYCLTGEIKEQVIVMLYGAGSNGKSVLMTIMKEIFGSYGDVLPFESLLYNDKKQGKDATPDLADLPATRLVMASEPELGAKFSSSMVKKVTGDGIMKVRHLHKGFFSFMPQFKITLSFNNKPSIRDPSDGMWRRLLLVPFDQQFFPPDEMKPGGLPIDPDLEKKLREELPGILNWILDGYRLWRESGLKIPEKIRVATSAYRHESNPVHEFIEDWCDLSPSARIQAGRLHEAYVLWCRNSAMEPMSLKMFGFKMKDLKFEKDRIGGIYHYKGIGLNDTALDHLGRNDRKRGGDDD